ncbi:MAG: tetratricopeptide repeat protein [Planctomycetes bacterium]|nr:tetratricopeptide repeat protein [Planctomycetota bacterium]
MHTNLRRRWRCARLWLLTTFTLAPVAAVLAEGETQTQARVFELDYAVNESAQPLESVQLWYTLDDGATWHQYGFDDDRQSPVAFHAPAEGLFGFVIVLKNAAGISGGPPTSATRPQLRVFVDFTPPVVQLHAPRQATSLGQRTLQIRWAAVDANLTTRPIELKYQRLPAGAWFPIVAEPVANTGRFDWRVPDDLVGAVAVRLAASDRGGNRTESEQQTIEITPVPPPEPAGGKGAAASARPNEPAATAEAARARAARLFTEALGHRDRGDYRQGISRLREAVHLDPLMTEAFTEMGGMLYSLGDYDRALSAYGVALGQRPNLRSALAGAAKVYSRRNDFSAAAERLRTILRYNPNDAEMWMLLGDVAVQQGDELLARECYTRASQIDPKAVPVVEEARRRLSLMAEASRAGK